MDCGKDQKSGLALLKPIAATHKNTTANHGLTIAAR